MAFEFPPLEGEALGPEVNAQVDIAMRATCLLRLLRWLDDEARRYQHAELAPGALSIFLLPFEISERLTKPIPGTSAAQRRREFDKRQAFASAWGMAAFTCHGWDEATVQCDIRQDYHDFLAQWGGMAVTAERRAYIAQLEGGERQRQAIAENGPIAQYWRHYWEAHADEY